MKMFFPLLCLMLLASCLSCMAQGLTKGYASYYADKFHGRRTASGEAYDKDGMTCAHRNYPFGTILKVCNPRNGRTVYVRVTDRGPYSKGRIIDLSRAAARELDIIRAGLAMVEITPFLSNEVPYRAREDSLTEVPDLELMYAPPIIFPEPIWERDSTNVSDELKKITSSWTFTGH